MICNRDQIYGSVSDLERFDRCRRRRHAGSLFLFELRASGKQSIRSSTSGNRGAKGAASCPPMLNGMSDPVTLSLLAFKVAFEGLTTSPFNNLGQENPLSRCGAILPALFTFALRNCGCARARDFRLHSRRSFAVEPRHPVVHPAASARFAVDRASRPRALCRNSIAGQIPPADGQVTCRASPEPTPGEQI